MVRARKPFCGPLLGRTSCAQLLVVLTFERGATSQFVMRRDNDGARFHITGAMKLQNDRHAGTSTDLGSSRVAGDRPHRRGSGEVLTCAFCKCGKQPGINVAE